MSNLVFTLLEKIGEELEPKVRYVEDLTDEELDAELTRIIDYQYYKLTGEDADPGPLPAGKLTSHRRESLEQLSDAELGRLVVEQGVKLLRLNPDAPWAGKLSKLLQIQGVACPTNMQGGG